MYKKNMYEQNACSTNKHQTKLTHIDNCTRHCTHCTYNWKALAVKIYIIIIVVVIIKEILLIFREQLHMYREKQT